MSSGSPQCPNMNGCALFPHLAKGGFMRIWQVNYCEGAYAKCERYKRGLAGKQVPTLLLPNGENLSSG